MLMSSIRTIGRSLALVAATGAFAWGAVAALTSPLDTVATTFSNGKIDLKIDSKATYNGTNVPSATWALKDLVPGVDKFFNFSDIKPGDYGCNVISIHTEK